MESNGMLNVQFGIEDDRTMAFIGIQLSFKSVEDLDTLIRVIRKTFESREISQMVLDEFVNSAIYLRENRERFEANDHIDVECPHPTEDGFTLTYYDTTKWG